MRYVGAAQIQTICVSLYTCWLNPTLLDFFLKPKRMRFQDQLRPVPWTVGEVTIFLSL